MCIRDRPLALTENTGGSRLDEPHFRGLARQEQEGGVVELHFDGVGHVAVSYTHLDVYKRQVPHNACGESPHLNRVGFPSAWRGDRKTKKVRRPRDFSLRPFAFSPDCVRGESPSHRRAKDLREDAMWRGPGSAHQRLSLRTPLFGNCRGSQPCEP